MEPSLGPRARLEAPARQVVPRRQDQCFGELPRDTTRLADPAVVAKLRDQYESQET